jgi:hypothetical protein
MTTDSDESDGHETRGEESDGHGTGGEGSDSHETRGDRADSRERRREGADDHSSGSDDGAAAFEGTDDTDAAFEGADDTEAAFDDIEDTDVGFGSPDDTAFVARYEVETLVTRPGNWVLVTGNRLVVAAGLLAGVAALLLGVVWSGLVPLVERDPTLFLLFALIGGNFTLITIVVSISQFVLARHLESPGEVREQMREVISYRQEVSDVTEESVVPVTQSGLLELLFRSLDREIEHLRETDWLDSETARGDPEITEEVDVGARRLLTELSSHVTRVRTLLEERNIAAEYTLLLVLDTDYSRYFSGAYRVRAAFGDSLPPSLDESLTRLERHIEQVDVARRYFKTVFIQSELASLSRLLLYVGVPVQFVSVVLMLLFTAPASPAISAPVLEVVIPIVVTAGFLPIVVLTVYILRLATLVRRTAAMYPFTTRVDEEG